MNYIINIKTRDLIVGAIILMSVSSKIEKKVSKMVKEYKKTKEKVDNATPEVIENATYCPCCGKKIKED